MSKELLLMQDVDGLGLEGEVVNVADGYARNYLLPRQKALPLSRVTKQRLERMQAAREARLAEELEHARKLSERMTNLSVTIPMKVGDQGKLFGSVQAADILGALKEQGVALEKRHVSLNEPLRELGVYDIPLKLHPDVKAEIKVWIVEE